MQKASQETGCCRWTECCVAAFPCSGKVVYAMKGTSINLLHAPIAALLRTRSLAYLFDMSRVLCAVRLALGSLATVFRGALK